MNNEKDYLDVLKDRLLELIALPISKEKYSSIENLVHRYTTELKEKIQKTDNIEAINQEFKHYVKNILSIVETLMEGAQYTALRRLLQNEIYSCCEIMIKGKNYKI